MRKEIFLPSSDGKNRLHGYVWEPEDGDVKAAVQLVHGMAEYIGRYSDFAEDLTRHGFAVIGHDHLGHGASVLSKDDLGFFADADGNKKLVEDMYRVSRKAEELWPGAPLFLLGHSMGSFLSRRYVTLHSDLLAGAVFMGTGNVSGSVAGLAKSLSAAVMRLKGKRHPSPFLDSLAIGSYNKKFKPNRTPVDWLSRNEENVDRYAADPLCGFLFTAGAYHDFFTVLKELADGVGEENIRRDLPVLVISGAEDPVGGTDACIDVAKHYKEIGVDHVDLQLYPGDRHEILNEVDRERVWNDLEKWFEDHIS